MRRAQPRTGLLCAKALACTLLGVMLSWVRLSAFEDSAQAARADSGMHARTSAPDTGRRVVDVNIAPNRIRLRYSDGSDSIVVRSDTPGARRVGYESACALIRIGKDVVVARGDTVRGDVIVIFGNLSVDGYVRGNVGVVFGDLNIGERASVEGRINCLGEVTVHPGAYIWGDISAFELILPPDPEQYDFKGKFNRIDLKLSRVNFFTPPTMLVMILVQILLLVLTALLTVIMPKPIARVRSQIEQGFVKCFLVGFLLMLAIFPFWILIMVTIIGIPVALLVYPFMVAGAFMLGALGFTQYAGFQLGRRTTLRYSGYLRTTLAGAVLIGSPYILATFFGFINMRVPSLAMYALFLATQIVLYPTGFGAVFFSRFGTRPTEIELRPQFDLPARPVLSAGPTEPQSR